MNDIDLAKVWETPKVECPMHSIGRRYTPFDHSKMQAILAEARRAEPVFYNPEIDHWVVTRYDDVLNILRNPKIYSASNANTPITAVPDDVLQYLNVNGYALEGIQVNCDPPRHTRIRNSVRQLLNPVQFRKLDDDIRRLVRDGLDRLEGKEEVELLHDFIYELPARVIFLKLGIPEEDAAQVKEWSVNRAVMSFVEVNHDQQMEAARNLAAFWQYCTDLVQKRIENPQDDYPSHLLALRNGDDSVLTVNEINSLVFGLLFAGHETSTSQTTSALHLLLSNRHAWEEICTDPSLIPNAVEESLRLEGAVWHWRRMNREKVTLGGVDIDAGSNLLLSLSSANRDESVFPEPEKFDIHRSNAHMHLTFGNGIHFCMGAPLGRAEVRIILEEITQRFPKLTLSERHQLSHLPALTFHVPESLWVCLNG